MPCRSLWVAFNIAHPFCVSMIITAVDVISDCLMMLALSLSVERVAVLCRFLDIGSVTKSHMLKYSLAHAFCCFLASIEDVNPAVATRARLLLDTIKRPALQVIRDRIAPVSHHLTSADGQRVFVCSPPGPVSMPGLPVWYSGPGPAGHPEQTAAAAFAQTGDPRSELGVLRQPLRDALTRGTAAPGLQQRVPFPYKWVCFSQRFTLAHLQQWPAWLQH